MISYPLQSIPLPAAEGDFPVNISGAWAIRTAGGYVGDTTGANTTELLGLNASVSGYLPYYTTTPLDGELLIGNNGGGGVTRATLTGVGITVANGAGSITLTAGSMFLFSYYADAGNDIIIGETDLFSSTTAASTLGADGNLIFGEWCGLSLGSATATSQFKVYFGGVEIYDSGALALSVSTDWCYKVSIIRESATVVRCFVTAFTTTASATPYADYTRITGLTLSNTNILKITGTRTGVGAASNDILGKQAFVSKLEA